jgi:hypothetical protein
MTVLNYRAGQKLVRNFELITVLQLLYLQRLLQANARLNPSVLVSVTLSRF